MFPIIGGFVPFTTIDYPNAASCVLFLQGCPWRCAYCYNPHFFVQREPTVQDKDNYDYVLNFLKKRTKTLDAIVFSGGEASCQADSIIEAITEFHKISKDFKIGLHTNGCLPTEVQKLLPHINWTGLDIKATPNAYESITKVKDSGKTAYESLKILCDSGKDFEVRTTCDPRFITKDMLLEIAQALNAQGVKTYALQRFRPINKDADDTPSQGQIMQFFTDKEFEDKLRNLIPNLILRW